MEETKAPMWAIQRRAKMQVRLAQLAELDDLAHQSMPPHVLEAWEEVRDYWSMLWSEEMEEAESRFPAPTVRAEGRDFVSAMKHPVPRAEWDPRKHDEGRHEGR